MLLIANTQDRQDMKVVETVKHSGVAIIPEVFSQSDIDRTRERVLANLHLMRNTRSNASSRHLAGFHRYPDLEQLHCMITSHPVIQSYLTELCGEHMRTIGLSDITVNRSQQWHKDLLRGKFQHLLGAYNNCSSCHGLAYKVLVYLQDSTSLQFIPGSHKQDIALDNDEQAIPADLNQVQSINAHAGDAVILDICTTHRGSKEEVLLSDEMHVNPRILISTVFGTADSEFTNVMEAGNAIRLSDWMQRNKAN